jgi:hypothetical protein
LWAAKIKVIEIAIKDIDCFTLREPTFALWTNHILTVPLK